MLIHIIYPKHSQVAQQQTKAFGFPHCKARYIVAHRAWANYTWKPSNILAESASLPLSLGEFLGFVEMAGYFAQVVFVCAATDVSEL